MKWNRIRVFGLVLIFGLLAVTAKAASLGDNDLPTNSNWYLHVNLELVRSSDVGRQFVMETFNNAMDEIQSEMGIDIREEIEGVTIFGGELPHNGNPISDGALVLHGAFSAETQAGLLSALEQKGALVNLAYEAGMAYYTIENNDGNLSYNDASLDGSQDVQFAFGGAQLLITQSPGMMQRFLSGGGYLSGIDQVSSGALLVMQADRALLQGGANTSADIGEEWDSSVLKNVDSVALLVAEEQGGLLVNAQLLATSAEVAMSVRNIVEGMVALKALSDTETVVGDVLRNVRFENDGAILKMRVAVAADQIQALKDL